MLEKKPVAGAKFIPGSASNPLEWTMMLDAPDTYTVGGAKRACPYAGHVFTVSIKFPNNYPFKAPDVSVCDGAAGRPAVGAPVVRRRCQRGLCCRREQATVPQQQYPSSAPLPLPPCPTRAASAATYPLPRPPPRRPPPLQMTFKPGELYHPNVNRETGEICADMISKTWGPTQNVTTLAKLVLGFLETPNMESPLDGDCAAELAASVDKYEASARKYAEKAPKKGSV